MRNRAVALSIVCEGGCALCAGLGTATAASGRGGDRGASRGPAVTPVLAEGSRALTQGYSEPDSKPAQRSSERPVRRFLSIGSPWKSLPGSWSFRSPLRPAHRRQPCSARPAASAAAWRPAGVQLVEMAFQPGRAARAGSGRLQSCRGAGQFDCSIMFGGRSAAWRKYEAGALRRRVGQECAAKSRTQTRRWRMRYQLIGIAAVVGFAHISSARAQAPSPSAAPQWPGPQQAYVGPYQPAPLLNAITPWDAYRQGLINRWELEPLQGPIPQALQGPSPNGRGPGRRRRGVTSRPNATQRLRRRVGAGDARQHREGASIAEGLVQGLPAPGRYRSRRAGRALRRRSAGAGVGEPAELLALRQPAGRFHRRAAVAARCFSPTMSAAAAIAAARIGGPARVAADREANLGD